MERMKEGDVITIDGIVYRVGPTSVRVINLWLEIWDMRLEVKSDNAVHLYEVGSKSGELIPASKIKAALAQS